MIKKRKMNTIVNITGLTLRCLGISEENAMLNKKKQASRKEYFKEYDKKRNKELKEIFKNNPKYRRDYLNERNLKSRLWIRNYEKEKRKNNANFRMANNLRRRLGIALKGIHKNKKTFQLLGCNLEQLWSHLEKSFKPGMTKQNYGLWHIDHIIPCASFDLTKPEQQEKCFHYTNLQALWAHENLSKGSKLNFC